MNPRVTVCIPIYNGSKFLEESLNSVKDQSYDNLEILIVDDHSSDNSIEISKKIFKGDNRAKIVKNEKQLGLVQNWNRCLELASSDWIKFHFQDDMMVPDTIKKMMALAEKEKVRLVLSDREYLFDKSREKKKDFFDNRLKRLSQKYDQDTVINCKAFSSTLNEWGIRQNFIGEPILGLVQRRIFQDYGKYDESLKHVVDMEFWLRIGLNESFAFTPERLHHFRVHSESQGAKNIDKRGFNPAYLDRITICKKLKTHPAYESYRKNHSLDYVNKFASDSVKFCILKYGYLHTKKILQTDMDLAQIGFIQLVRGLFKDIESLFLYRLKFN